MTPSQILIGDLDQLRVVTLAAQGERDVGLRRIAADDGRRIDQKAGCNHELGEHPALPVCLGYQHLRIHVRSAQQIEVFNTQISGGAPTGRAPSAGCYTAASYLTLGAPDATE